MLQLRQSFTPVATVDTPETAMVADVDATGIHVEDFPTDWESPLQ